MAIARKSANKRNHNRTTGVASVSLADRAYERIRYEILQGSFGVGDILSRRRLADQLHMSFLPITEALQRLESDGLVESRPRIGTRVRIPTRQDILDSYVLREALETQAARLCCAKMTDAERKQLISSAQHLDDLYKDSATNKKPSRFHFFVHTHHTQFHTRIAELSQSPGLLKAIEKEQVLVFNWLYDIAVGQETLPPDFHYELATAICSGNIKNADAAMRKHIQHGMGRVVQNMGTLEVARMWRHKRSA